MKTNQTQVQVPKGWCEHKAGDVFSYVRTYAFSRDALSENQTLDGIQNVHYGDIHSTFFASSIDLEKVQLPTIKDGTFVPKKEDLLRDGDLIMVDASEDYAGVGVTVSVHGVGDSKVVGGLHTFVLRDTSGTTDERYRQYIFRNPDIRRKMQKVANGVSVYGVSKTEVAKLVLSLPPLPEQKRIVKVLETWDRAIELTERKIALKREVKKGLMQRLLTGKVRLPGFSGEWKVAKLRDIYAERKQKCKETPGLKLYSLTIEDGVCPKSERYDRSFLVKGEKEYKRTQEYDLVYNPANLRFGAIAQNKNVEPVLLSPIYQVLYVKDTKKYNADFLGHLLTWERQVRKMSTYAEGTLIERMEVKIESFKQIVVDVPKKEEQDKIASVFNDAGIEIKLLEEKLTLLKDQKKYLLNNLVTGAIRTPENI